MLKCSKIQEHVALMLIISLLLWDRYAMNNGSSVAVNKPVQ